MRRNFFKIRDLIWLGITFGCSTYSFLPPPLIKIKINEGTKITVSNDLFIGKDGRYLYVDESLVPSFFSIQGEEWDKFISNFLFREMTLLNILCREKIEIRWNYHSLFISAFLILILFFIFLKFLLNTHKILNCSNMV